MDSHLIFFSQPQAFPKRRFSDCRSCEPPGDRRAKKATKRPPPLGGEFFGRVRVKQAPNSSQKAGAAFRGCMAFGGETTNNRSWKRRFFSPQLINRKGLICRSIRQAARPAFGATRALPSAELRERLSPWKPLGKSGASAHAKGTNPNWKLSQAYGPSSTLGMPKREPFDKPPNCEDG